MVVPVGGGGLIAGSALRTEGSAVAVFGVEPLASPAMSASLAAGTVAPIAVGPTIADGLAGNIEAGSITVDICARHGVEMHTVSEVEIRSAIRFLAFEYGVVAEGAGAVAVAALLAGSVVNDGGPMAVIVTGRNIDPPLLASVLSDGE